MSENTTRPLDWDRTFLEIARSIGDMSYAERKKVGALLVRNGSIIEFGYNGMPSGYNNCCENEHGVTNPEVLHAESNVITKVAKSVNSTVGATLYLTLSPCLDCAKIILQSGISRVVYSEEYRLTDGIKFLIKNKVKVDHIVSKTEVICSIGYPGTVTAGQVYEVIKEISKSYIIKCDDGRIDKVSKDRFKQDEVNRHTYAVVMEQKFQ